MSWLTKWVIEHVSTKIDDKKENHENVYYL